MEINQLFTIDYISSLAGMTLVIMLITQFTKGLIDIIYNKVCGLFNYKSDGFPTNAWVAILSEIIIFTTLYLNGQITDNQSIYLASINGLALAAISMESYKALQSKVTTNTVVVNNTTDNTTDTDTNTGS
jgi:hypothetical protein